VSELKTARHVEGHCIDASGPWKRGPLSSSATATTHWRCLSYADDTRLFDRTAPRVVAFSQVGRPANNAMRWSCQCPRTGPLTRSPQGSGAHNNSVLAANRPDFASSTAASVCSGIIEMREYSEYVVCPCCGETMRLARTVTHANLPAMETFECKPCGLAVDAEAVSGSHALIEKRYLY
jgi:hypothetical protein